MEINQEIINNLSAFASIISIPISLTIFLIDNNKKIKKALEECAVELCKILFLGEPIDEFKINKIAESITYKKKILWRRNLNKEAILSETLLLIRRTPFLQNDQKQSLEERLIIFWKNHFFSFKPSRSVINRILSFTLIVITTFIIIDYFSGGFALKLVKFIKLSIIFKIIAAFSIILISLILAILIFELIYRDKNYGRKYLNSTTINSYNVLSSPIITLYSEDQKYYFTKIHESSFFVKQVVDTGPQFLSRRGYRLLYEMENRKIIFFNSLTNLSLEYRFEKKEIVNGGLLFDILHIELYKKKSRIAFITKLIALDPDIASNQDIIDRYFSNDWLEKFKILKNIKIKNTLFQEIIMPSDGNSTEKDMLYIDKESLLPIKISEGNLDLYHIEKNEIQQK